MTDAVQVFDGDGLIALDPEKLYDQVWEAEIGGVTSWEISLEVNDSLRIDLTRPTPETVAKLDQIKQFLQKHVFLRVNVTINGDDWDEMCIMSILIERPDFWIVSAVQ